MTLLTPKDCHTLCQLVEMHAQHDVQLHRHERLLSMASMQLTSTQKATVQLSGSQEASQQAGNGLIQAC